MSNFKQTLLLSVLFSTSIQALTLQEAEEIASKHSNLAKQAQLSSQSFEQLAQAAGEYADPKLNFGLFNLPTDDFSISQNPTTQFRVGIKQMLPRGSLLDYKRAQRNNLSQAQNFKAVDILLNTQKNTRLAFLDLYNHVEKKEILKSSRNNFIKLVELTQQKFGNGFANQQTIINAELQLAKLDDNIYKTQDLIEQIQSTLSLLVLDKAYSEIDSKLPKLKVIGNMSKDVFVQDILPNHPAIEQVSAMITALDDKLAISQEMKKPAWTVGFEYRKRFGDNPGLTGRSDMLAMTASLDLPLFADKKQNRVVAANHYQIQASEELRLERFKKFTSNYQKFSGILKLSKQRLNHYQINIENKTQANTKAALQAYQNGKSDFATLIMAQNLELDTEIEILNLKIKIEKTKAQLLYLTNEKGGTK